MNTDIRIAVSFKGHRKRKRLKMILGPGSTDYLLDFWISTAMNHPSGVLTGMDEVDIALEAGWDGNPREFVRALIEAKFIDCSEDGVYALHDWEDHQGYVVHAADRTEKARKAARARYEKAKSTNDELPVACSEHASSMQTECSAYAPSPAPSPTPAPTPAPIAKEKHIPENLIDFSRAFHEDRRESFPTRVKEVTEKQIKDGAESLQVLTRKGYDLEAQIKPALRWGVDDEFWKDQLLSLSGLTRKSESNGLMKFVNLLTAFEKNGCKPKKSDHQKSYMDAF